MEASRDELARFFSTVLPHLNELQRRVVAGAVAVELGRGGKSAVAEASGMSRNTVIKAEREVLAGIEPSVRQRAVGGGDIPAEVKQPGLLEALDELVNPETRGNPMSFLRWTSKSTASLAAELVRQGFRITEDTVGRILKSLGYSLQAPAKEKEGASHPDRNAQFVYLNDLVRRFVEANQPVISVDTKKKELVGESPTAARNITPKASRPGPRPTTSSTPPWGGRCPTVSTTSPMTKGGYRWATPPIPPPSRSRPSDGGGRRWARFDTPTPPVCSSPPMPGAPTATGSACGK